MIQSITTLLEASGRDVMLVCPTQASADIIFQKLYELDVDRQCGWSINTIHRQMVCDDTLGTLFVDTLASAAQYAGPSFLLYILDGCDIRDVVRRFPQECRKNVVWFSYWDQDVFKVIGPIT